VTSMPYDEATRRAIQEADRTMDTVAAQDIRRERQHQQRSEPQMDEHQIEAMIDVKLEGFRCETIEWVQETVAALMNKVADDLDKLERKFECESVALPPDEVGRHCERRCKR
jgi:hypothetical protein